jgi:hypothetical protein
MSVTGRIPLRALTALLALVLLGAGFAVLTGVASGHPTDQTDLDHDLIKNDYDNCPSNYNPKQQDFDKDSEAYIKTSAIPPTEIPGNNGTVGGNYYGWTESATLPDGSPDPRNRPTGVGGDACDEDDDNDLFPDKRSSKPEYRNKPKDNCPKAVNPGQEDADFDGIGDVCDSDDDNDGILDPADNCALVSNSDQQDHDSDKIGNACDPDAPKGSGSLAGRDPNDKTAPKVATRIGRRQRFAEILAGLTVPVTCSEGCTLEGELIVPGKTAKRLKVARKASKTFVLARGAAQIEDKGFTFVFVKLSKTTLQRVQRARSLKSTLRLTAQDANGNRSVLQRRITLRR